MILEKLVLSIQIEILLILELFELIDIEELFESLLERHQDGLEQKMKGSEFVYDSTDLLHYKLHKISLNRGGS